MEVHVLQGEREFAHDNKTLGRFNLDGISPAPRGVPQIEVTFDIDANGIVNVSAVDKGTNREQHITITASSNLTEDEIDKAVKEAEQFAAEDKQKKSEIDTKNNADSAVYQAEKLLKDEGDKFEAVDRSDIETAVSKLKESISANSMDEMKQDTDALQQAIYKASENLYKKAQTEQAQGDQAHSSYDDSGTQGTSGNGTYEADFKDAGNDPE